jgi:two-component system NtrC family sensor kinase
VRDACLAETYRVGQSYAVPPAECPGLRPAAARGSRRAAPVDLLLVPLRGAGGRLIGTLLIDDGRHRDARNPAAVAGVELLAAQMSRLVERRQLDLSARNAQLRLRKAEDQLLQSDKLSAIGQLISGVAHELNNPLSGVMGFTQLLQSGESNPKVRQSLDRIYNEAVRCQKIVQNLLSFARRHQPEKSARSLNEVIESVLDLRAYQLQVDDVEVERRYDPDLPQTMLDFHQLQQVVLNLVNNAHQAMMATSGRPRRLTIVTERRGDRLCAAFTDTGPGISQDRMSRIFEPFFTTKEPGKGTGLGLSVSLGIVKSHEGAMSVESALGQGTTFRFELPLVECRKTQAPVAEPAPQAPAPTRRLRLLVVDDEEVLTELLTDVLRSAGHEVDKARDGRTALAMALKHSYDAILTDLKMPGLDGQGLYVALCQHRPEMRHRFVFSTGDLANPKVQTFFQQSGCASLSKPFKLESVLKIVEQVGSLRHAA